MGAAVVQADSLTTRMGATKPDIGGSGWGVKTNANWDIIDASACVIAGTNDFTGANSFSSNPLSIYAQPLRFYDSSLGRYVSLQAAGTVTTTAFVLPSADGVSGQCLSTNGAGTLSFTTVSSGGTGAGALAVTTGSASGFNATVQSSPTAVVNFNSSQFNVLLKGGATAYTTLNASSVTLMGNTFNQASNLVQLNASAQLPALDGSLLTGVVTSGVMPGGATSYWNIPSTGTFPGNYGVFATTVTASSITVSGLNSGECVQTGAGGLLTTTGAACTPQSGDTSYIDNTSTLQSGATFYVSSGTVNGRLVISSGTPPASSDSTITSNRPIAYAVGTSGTHMGIASYLYSASDPSIAFYGNSQLVGAGTVSYGSNFTGAGGTTTNYGVKAQGGAGTGNQYGVYAEGLSASISGTRTNYGGFFKGDNSAGIVSNITNYGVYADADNGDACYGIYADAYTCNTSYGLYVNRGQVQINSSATINQGLRVSTLTVVSQVTDTYEASFSTSTLPAGFFHVAISTSGHIITSGPKPTISSCGTGSPSVAGNDNEGTITVGGGAVTACTLTFASTWGTTPTCVITSNSTASTGDISAISSTAFTASFSLSVAGGSIFYRCGCSGNSCL